MMSLSSTHSQQKYDWIYFLGTLEVYIGSEYFMKECIIKKHGVIAK